MTLRKRNKLVFGVGINDADYVTNILKTIDGKRKSVWSCPYYTRWLKVLERCYSERYKGSTYSGCFASEDWHTFSNFKEWMQGQDWKGKDLDKDILVEGNREYGPDTCVFVDHYINSFLVDCRSARGSLPVGVTKQKNGKYASYCRNPFSGKQEHLGTHSDPVSAHSAWLSRKKQHAVAIAQTQKDVRVSEALINRFS